jgi:hypothetical protein
MPPLPVAKFKKPVEIKAEEPGTGANKKVRTGESGKTQYTLCQAVRGTLSFPLFLFEPWDL